MSWIHNGYVVVKVSCVYKSKSNANGKPFLLISSLSGWHLFLSSSPSFPCWWFAGNNLLIVFEFGAHFRDLGRCTVSPSGRREGEATAAGLISPSGTTFQVLFSTQRGNVQIAKYFVDEFMVSSPLSRPMCAQKSILYSIKLALLGNDWRTILETDFINALRQVDSVPWRKGIDSGRC